MSFRLTFRRASADAIVLYFGETIDPKTHRDLMQCYGYLQKHLGHGFRSLIPSYASIVIRYDPLVWQEAQLQGHLRKHCRGQSAAVSHPPPPLEIPVWYDPSVGWDLEAVSRRHGLATEELIARHCAPVYHVYAVGFLPGFGYLGRLDTRLATPRLATPRAKIPAGSVAIADRQTAVYPMESPGGWSILGRTPLKMFDPRRTPASLTQVGMEVRFTAIEREHYRELGGILP